MEKRIIGHEARTQRWGYFFVAPFVVVFCIFNFWPTLNTFLLSFSDIRGFKSNFDFAGLTNFVKLMKDQYFWGALGNTFIIWGFNFVPQLGIALLLALWLSDMQLSLGGRNLFRAIVYMPNLLTAVSVAMLFRSLFGWGNHFAAPANQLLGSLGIKTVALVDGVPMVDPVTGEVVKEAINFFRGVPFTRGLVAFIQWWMWYGHTLIMLMAGITSIPVSLSESAMIDGANSRQIAWRITLPLLRPMMLYILITSMIGGMQMFDIPFLISDTRGSPSFTNIFGKNNFAVRTTAVHQYQTAFGVTNDYAYGAAVSVGIFFVTIILALLIFFFMQDRSDLKRRKGGKV
jgi:multiple sugar transport system permease protein